LRYAEQIENIALLIADVHTTLRLPLAADVNLRKMNSRSIPLAMRSMASIAKIPSTNPVLRFDCRE
jgi:hypothetical protein